MADYRRRHRHCRRHRGAPSPSYPHCGFAALFIQNNLNRHYLCIQLAFSTQTPHVEHLNPNPRPNPQPNPHPNPSCHSPPSLCVRATFTDSFGFVFAFHLYFNALHKCILILIRCLVQCDIREHTHICTYIYSIYHTYVYVYVWYIKRDNCSRFYARLSFEFPFILQPYWEYEDKVWFVCSIKLKILHTYIKMS